MYVLPAHRPALSNVARVLVVLVAILASNSRWAMAGESPSPADPPPSGKQTGATNPADDSAVGMMRQTVSEMIAILGDQSLSRSQKQDRVSALTRQRMDFQTLGRMTLGNSWRDLTDAQRGEFVTQFTNHLLGIYLPVVTEYSGQKVSIGEDRAEAGGDHTVFMKVTDDKGPGGSQRQVAALACRLRCIGENWKAIDLSIEGISVAMIFRAQFQPVMLSSGIDALIDRLRKKDTGTGKEGARGDQQ